MKKKHAIKCQQHTRRKTKISLQLPYFTCDHWPVNRDSHPLPVKCYYENFVKYHRIVVIYPLTFLERKKAIHTTHLKRANLHFKIKVISMKDN